MIGNPLSDAKLDEHELAWIGAGMAAGHLQQAARAASSHETKAKRRARHVVRLEHMHAACEWLRFSARYKVLASV